MFPILTLTIFALIYFYLLGKGKIRSSFNEYLKDYKLLIKILVIWLIIGFFFNLDYSNRWGCIIGREPIFGKLNVIFSSTSIFLTIIASVRTKKSIKLCIHLMELCFWTGKLMIYKGGYATGIAGIPSTEIVFYDFIAIILRLLVIRSLWTNMKTSIVLLLTLMIISTKIFAFQTQKTILWEHEESLERAKMTLKKMQGDWTGIKTFEKSFSDTILRNSDSIIEENDLITMIENDKVIKERKIEQNETVRINLKSNQISINCNDHETFYLIDFESEYSAILYEILPDSLIADKNLMDRLKTNLKVKSEWINNSMLYIRKIDEDSLIFDEGDMMFENRYKLKK
jgi:hypothetical protein